MFLETTSSDYCCFDVGSSSTGSVQRFGLGPELDSYEAFPQGAVLDALGSWDVVRAPGSRIRSYPAEHGVPDQNASCEANQLKAAGPLFGDGSSNIAI